MHRRKKVSNLESWEILSQKHVPFYAKLLNSKLDLIQLDLALTSVENHIGCRHMLILPSLSISTYYYVNQKLCLQGMHLTFIFSYLLGPYLDLDRFKYDVRTHAVPFLDMYHSCAHLPWTYTSTLGEVDIFAARLTDL